MVGNGDNFSGISSQGTTILDYAYDSRGSSNIATTPTLGGVMADDYTDLPHLPNRR